MLPSSGYFRSISCPFFENGLCERPHCHFKHVRKDVDANSSSSFSSDIEFTENKPTDLLRIVNEAVKKMQQEVDGGPDLADIDATIDKEATKIEMTDTKSGNKYLNCLNVDLKRKKDATSDKLSTKTSSTVLEYKPTPISKLKQMQQENKYTKVMELEVDELEYDPVSNYSANVDNVKSSRIPYIPSKKRTQVDTATEKVGVAKKMKKSKVEESEICGDELTKSSKEVECSKKFDIIDQILTESKICEMAINSTNKTTKKVKSVQSSSSSSSKTSPKKKVKDSSSTSKSKSIKTSSPKSSSSTSKSPKPSKSSTKSSKSTKTTQGSSSKDDKKLNSSTDLQTPSKKSTKTTNSLKSSTKPSKPTEYEVVHVVVDKKTDEPDKRLPEIKSTEDDVEIVSDDEDVDDSSHVYDLLEDSDVDEHDTYEECLKIFNEYVPTPVTNGDHKETKIIPKVEDISTSAKKRVAHSACNDNKIALSRKAKLSEVRPSKLSLSQVMVNRYGNLPKVPTKVPQTTTTSAKSSAFLSTVNASSSGKRRIAHVPNASALVSPSGSTNSGKNSNDKNHLNTVNAKVNASNDTTVAHTAAKGVKRIAHNPKQVSNRPIITPEYGSKVPTNIRQRYLNAIVDECIKLYPEEEDAHTRALSEEKNAYLRSSNRAVYINVAVNTIHRIRNESSGMTPIAKLEELQIKKTLPKTVSHEFVLGGKKAANVSYSIERRRSSLTDDINDKLLHEMLQTYLLTKQQMEENGYPIAHATEPGKAVIIKQNAKKKSTNELERVCCRCGSTFKVNSKGVYLNPEECIYHWGKAFKRRIAGALENRYTCCSGDLESMGCCINKVHVSDNIQYDNLRGFVTTLPKSVLSDSNYEVYALDCEMSYTVQGCELTRVTVIDSKMKTVYETLVKPENEIVDYNTKFSGITEDDLKNVTTSLRDVQAVLLSKFNNKTILIGHSLESDFLALKLIHETVVDTSIVFPHRLGLPYKRALRNLMAEYMNKIIQNNLDGHDSQEDAVSCMELMIWKIKEDLKKKRF